MHQPPPDNTETQEPQRMTTVMVNISVTLEPNNSQTVATVRRQRRLTSTRKRVPHQEEKLSGPQSHRTNHQVTSVTSLEPHEQKKSSTTPGDHTLDKTDTD